MAVHFAPTLDAIGEAQDALRCSPLMSRLRLHYSFLSVTEAGLYHLTAELARETHGARRRSWRRGVCRRTRPPRGEERENAHVQRRLYPPLPEDMPYVCFYPMSKRRGPDRTGMRSRSLNGVA